MIFFRTAVAGALLLSASGANAQVALWRTLQSGDSPDVAMAKLLAMPEVKKVKNKTKKGAFERQDIDMQDGAVPIFDGHFSVATGFEDGALSIVRLTSGRGCVRDGHPLAAKIEAELLKKYPSTEMKLIDEASFNLRALDATSLEPTSTTTIYVGDDVAALFRVKFYREDPPQYYGGSALNRSLYNLARTMYDQKADACGGMGYLTAEISISYIPRTDYEARRRQFEDKQDADREKAADNL